MSDRSQSISADVCVLGGGPAGSLIARNLARLGHDVALVERGTASPWAAGESLPQSVLPFLSANGLAAVVGAAAFRQDDEKVILWQSDRPYKRLTDGHVLVDRRRLDPLMRQMARNEGARLLELCRAGQPARMPGGWNVPLKSPKGAFSVSSRFLVDARGRRRRAGSGQPLLSIWGAWRPVDRWAAVTRIEAGQTEWYWGCPQPNGLFGAAVFVDPRRAKVSGRMRRTAFYRERLAASRLLGELAKGELVGDLHLRDATAATASRLIGRDFILVGDAAVAVDPLTSQGLQMALRSAVHASAAVHSLLADPNASAPLQFYGLRQQNASARARVATAGFYAHAVTSAGDRFWSSRAIDAEIEHAEKQPHIDCRISPDKSLRLSAHARVATVAVLRGDGIEWHPAIDHPNLSEPVAYLGGIAVAQLVADIEGAVLPAEILRRWSQYLAPKSAGSALEWMLKTGILTST